MAVSSDILNKFLAIFSTNKEKGTIVTNDAEHDGDITKMMLMAATKRGHQGDSLLHCAASTAQLAIVNFCLQVAHASVYLRLTFTIQHFCRPESSLTLSTVSLRLLCIKWELQ